MKQAQSIVILKVRESTLVNPTDKNPFEETATRYNPATFHTARMLEF